MQDEWLTLDEVAEHCKVHRTTVWLWIRIGVTDPLGRTVKLRAQRFGRKWRTKLAYLEEFSQACTGDQKPVDDSSTAKRRREMEREQERAREILKSQ